jgi:hypothetical protein
MLIQKEAQYNSQLGCEDCPSQPTCAPLTTPFQKPCGEKRARRKVHAHVSSLYMFSSASIFQISSSLGFNSFRRIYNMIYRLFSAVQVSTLGSSFPRSLSSVSSWRMHRSSSLKPFRRRSLRLRSLLGAKDLGGVWMMTKACHAAPQLPRRTLAPRLVRCRKLPRLWHAAVAVVVP